MKSYLLCILLLCTIGATLSAQTTYYSRNTTTNFNTLSGWATNRDGTGTNPPNLNNSRRLVVQDGHVKNTSAAASINRLTIEEGGTVTGNHPITFGGGSAQFVIEDGGIYIHDNTANVSNTIFNGTEVFSRQSTFQINRWQSAGTSITPAALTQNVPSLVDANDYYYGNLIVNWAASGNWNQAWPSYPTATYFTAGNFTINAVGDFRFTQNNNALPDVYIAGNFTMNSTGAGSNTLNFSSGNNSVGYINVNGNVNHSNGTITASSASSYGYIWTYGTSSANWSFPGGSRVRVAYYLTGAKTITLGSNFALGSGLTGPKFVISSTSTVLDLQHYTLSESTAGAYLSNTGTVRTSRAEGLWTNGQTNRSISNANGFYLQSQPNSTIIYYGAANQVVSSLSGATAPFDSYENLTILGGNTKILEGNTTVNRVFNFSTSGNYLSIGQHSLTIANTGSVSNAGNTSYFILNPTSNTNGRIRQNGLAATARIFPIGSSTSYLPVTITPASTGSDFSLSVFRGTTTNGLPAGTAFGSRNMQVDAVWQIDRPNGSANATVRFDWGSNLLEGAGFSATPNTQIGIWRYQAGNWILTPPGAYTNDNILNFSSTAGAITSFGTAGTGYAYIIANIFILPGRLVSFSGSTNATDNLLKWEVADPASYNRFELEESTDGLGFRKAAEVNIAGQQTNYNFTDKLVKERVKYYRLKMWDIFNNVTYSHVVNITRPITAGIVLLQNPVRESLVFRHPASSTPSGYLITDLTGRVYVRGTIPSNIIQTSISISQLPAAVYVLKYFDQSTEQAKTFVKQ